MGFAGMVSRDFIDKDNVNGVNTGWSPVSTPITYSRKEREVLRKLKNLEALNMDTKGDSVEQLKNIDSIVFYKKIEKANDKELERGAVGLIKKWRFVLESRRNRLLHLKRKMKFQGSQASIEVSISDIECAYKNVMQILKNEWNLSVTEKQNDDSDDNFEQVFASSLLEGIISIAKAVTAPKLIEAIISDMKYLAAVILGKKDENDEYVCSAVEYIGLLKKMKLTYESRECPECYVETAFREIPFCLNCGKRIVR